MNINPARSLSFGKPLMSRLIKFRHGAREEPKVSSAHGSGAAVAGSQAAPGEPIYDFQLPQRWRRPPIDEKEIDAINSGGAY